MLIKQCSADSDTRNVAKLFFISLKAQLFVFLLDFYTYLWLHIDLFVGVLLLFKSLYLCFICAKAQLFVFHVYIWLNLYFFRCGQSVGQWVIDSFRFGDSYGVSELVLCKISQRKLLISDPQKSRNRPVFLCIPNYDCDRI